MELTEENLQTYYENQQKIKLKTVTVNENGKEGNKTLTLFIDKRHFSREEILAFKMSKVNA